MMANALPTQQHAKQPKIGIFEIVLVGIVLVFLFGILNYFNILSLSNLWPNQFGFLPHQQSKQFNNSTIQQSNNITPILRTKLSCPSVKEFCEKGEGILKDGAYVGIGYKLSSGSAIFAAFDGDLTATSSSYPIKANGKTIQQNFKILYLDNSDLRLRGVYFFRGPRLKIKTGKVQRGEQIATAGGGTIAIYDNSSLIFSLIPGYPGSNTPAILNKEDFD